jgi:hypothetical protein
MTPQELQQCLEEAFGNLEPPYFEEVFESVDLDRFEAAVRTETGRAKRWQETPPVGPIPEVRLSSLHTHVESVAVLPSRVSVRDDRSRSRVVLSKSHTLDTLVRE